MAAPAVVHDGGRGPQRIAVEIDHPLGQVEALAPALQRIGRVPGANIR
jgi:hypothetical protein